MGDYDSQKINRKFIKLLTQPAFDKKSFFFSNSYLFTFFDNNTTLIIKLFTDKFKKF